MAEANLKTLLIEGGGPSYGITGGDLDARRPAWLNGTRLTRVDVPGLYKSIFADGGGLTCGSLTNAYGGCTIGGSSAINAGLFFEPPASDFDLYFPAGWKSADMKTAIAKLYAMQPSTNITSGDGKRYLQSGYDAARQWLVNGLGFIEADINRYKNNKTQVFGHPIYDYFKGQRGGPVTNYLQNALKLQNFHLQSGVRVVQVQRKLGQAIGVVVSINGVEKTIGISESGRVILSAGAIQSPSVLMFSGIGDPTVLSKLQTAGKLGNLTSSEWINSTAVGAGLFDNPNTFIELQSSAVQSYVYSYADPPIADEDLYLHNPRSGPYTFASQTSVFWDTTTRADGSIVAFQGTIDSSGYGAYTNNNTITLNIYGTSGLLSRGKVVLDSNFIPGPSSDVYYSNPQDSADIAAFIHKIFAGLPSSSLTPLNIPQNATVDEINTYITTYSLYARGEVNHWSSSCGLGSCVDVNTTVIGMKNLHVVDASIVAPLTVNPQFGVMAAAERAAELILGMG
jgi:cellobiose dehydrogenase (acceptor)